MKDPYREVGMDQPHLTKQAAPPAPTASEGVESEDVENAIRHCNEAGMKWAAGVLSAQRDQNAALVAEVERLKALASKYANLADNADASLAAAEAKVAELREALTRRAVRFVLAADEYRCDMCGGQSHSNTNSAMEHDSKCPLAGAAP